MKGFCLIKMEKKRKMEIESVEKDLSRLLEITLNLEHELELLDYNN